MSQSLRHRRSRARCRAAARRREPRPRPAIEAWSETTSSSPFMTQYVSSALDSPRSIAMNLGRSSAWCTMPRETTFVDPKCCPKKDRTQSRSPGSIWRTAISVSFIERGELVERDRDDRSRVLHCCAWQWPDGDVARLRHRRGSLHRTCRGVPVIRSTCDWIRSRSGGLRRERRVALSAILRRRDRTS